MTVNAFLSSLYYAQWYIRIGPSRQELFRIVMGGKLDLAPVQTEFTGKVLDVGTGTGIGAIKMGLVSHTLNP